MLDSKKKKKEGKRNFKKKRISKSSSPLTPVEKENFRAFRNEL